MAPAAETHSSTILAFSAAFFEAGAFFFGGMLASRSRSARPHTKPHKPSVLPRLPRRSLPAQCLASPDKTRLSPPELPTDGHPLLDDASANPRVAQGQLSIASGSKKADPCCLYHVDMRVIVVVPTSTPLQNAVPNL
jgi:hypothetical protein